MIHLCRPAVLCRAVTIVLLTMAIAFPSVVDAAAPSIFEVRDVKVDVTAKTAAAAREQALADGEVEAFRLLIERLTLPADRALLPELTRLEIASLVKDFSVAEEKASTVRYLASLDYTFKADKVRRLLVDSGVPYAATRSKPVLVLPVYQSAGVPILWDDPNPWRDAWAARPEWAGLVPTLVPLGDLADIAAIDVQQAVEGDPARLAALARRYGTGDTLVVQAVQEDPAAAGPPELKVSVARYRPEGRVQAQVRKFRAGEGETLDAVFDRAVDAITGQIENDWKQENLLRFDRPSVAAVTVPITALGDWLAVRRRLADVAVLQRIDLVLLSRDQARVNLYYAGTPHQLLVALEQADLSLVQEGAEWVLGLTPAVAPNES
jgi:hypothetical protein